MPALEPEPITVLRELHSTPSRRYLGYPARGRWAEPRRQPLRDVVHWNHWGSSRPAP